MDTLKKIKKIRTPKINKTERFITKSKEKHGDFYDYSKVDYVHSKTKVEIVCPDHGSFMQEPGNHLWGFGCPKCGVKKRIVLLRSSLDDFITAAESKYGKKYDFSKVLYTHSQEKVKIICTHKDKKGKPHGEFQRTPNSFLNGWECDKCNEERSKEKSNTRLLSNKEEFIAKAIEIYGDEQYDYSKMKYVNLYQSVKIICKDHGIFKRRPKSFLAGIGCFKCKNKSHGK